jgi:hypothetical protein
MMPVEVPVDYDTNAAGLEKQLTSDVTKAGDKAGRSGGGALSKGFLKATAGIGAAIGVKELFGDFISEARESQKVGALTANVIKTTGGAANVTAKQVGDLSTAISNKVGIDDEAIQSGANLLLTFKQVRNEVGKGNDIFDRATKAAVDLSASGFGDLNGASKQLGKALNDPIKGITALARSGVTFTDSQKEQIKSLVESGHLLEAQKIILREVESQVKGSAEAQATAGEKAEVAFKNLEEQIGTALLPTIDKLANFVSTKAVPAISEFVTQFEDGTGTAGDIRDALEGVYSVGVNVVKFLDDLPGPVKKFAIEGAIAYGVLNKLSGGFVSLGGGAIPTFVRGMANAETRLATTATAANALGGALRTAAGAGGAVLLADGIQKTNSQAGLLETTMGGLLSGGSLGAFGGPVGAGIGAGIGAIAGATTYLWQETGKANKEAEISIGTWKDYQSTLDETTGAQTKLTKAMTYQRLESSGLLTTTEALGLSDRTATQAILGNEAARKKLSDALIREQKYHTNGVSEKAIQALYDESGALYAATEAQLKQNVATAQGKKQVDAAREALERFHKTNGVGTISLRGYNDTSLKLQKLQRQLYDLFHTKPQSGNGGSNGLSDLFPDLSGGAQGSSGRIVAPTVTSSGSGVVQRASAPAASYAQSVTNNFYGPTTARAKNTETDWALRFGTRSIAYSGGVPVG